MKTYIIINDMRYAAVEAEARGIDTHGSDTVRVRTIRQVEGNRLEVGDVILDLTVGNHFDTLHRNQGIWDVLRRNAASSGTKIVEAADDNRFFRVRTDFEETPNG